jgi:hypothetical protein
MGRLFLFFLMTRQKLARMGIVAVLCFAFVSPILATWKEKALYSFQGIPDGSLPVGAVVFDKAGNLYGATTEGGSSSCISVAQCGTVYQLAPPAKPGDPWTETVLHIFKGNTGKDGASPAGGLVIDSVGNLYGTTAYGGTGNCVVLGTLMGCGTVYKMSPPQQKGGRWTETVLYSFPTPKQGFLPNGDLVFDGVGNLYGGTEFGGDFGTTCDPFYKYCGAVFELSPPKTNGGEWTEQVLHGFRSGTDGANPNGGLVLDSKGSVYGTTYGGGDESGECGSGGCGTAFELTPPAQKGGSWTETILHRFNRNTSDNGVPSAGFAIDAKGNLYGSTVGTLFRLTASPPKSGRWKETILYTFNQEAYGPKGTLIFDTSGNLYGAAEYGSNGSRYGSVFRLRPNTKDGAWTFGILYSFTGSPDGAQPAAKLIFDAHGDLYGTTQGGGTGTNCSGYCGTVFEVWP